MHNAQQDDLQEFSIDCTLIYKDLRQERTLTVIETDLATALQRIREYYNRFTVEFKSFN